MRCAFCVLGTPSPASSGEQDRMRKQRVSRPNVRISVSIGPAGFRMLNFFFANRRARSLCTQICLTRAFWRLIKKETRFLVPIGSSKKFGSALQTFAERYQCQRTLCHVGLRPNVRLGLVLREGLGPDKLSDIRYNLVSYQQPRKVCKTFIREFDSHPR